MQQYSWVLLFLAGVFEIFMTMSIKYSVGFTKPLPSLVFVVAVVLSFYLFSISIKYIPLGVAYSVWTSIGIVGTVIIGVVLFKEKLSLVQHLCILQIIMGAIILKKTCSP